MSGIACIYNLNGRPAGSTLIRRMSAVSPYRGPDGIRHWNEGPVALASLTFWTTPEAVHETQPLFDETNTLCLIMDGRVDNRVELRADLESAGAVLRADTDAELVLRAYQRWGERCPNRIVGDFAFLVWNVRRRELFCARDVLGIKPLYYYADANRFLCASELHQLFECPEVPREPNEGMVAEYLAAAPTNCEETLYRSIMRLPPAHCLSVQRGGIRKWRYWDVDFTKAIRYQSDNEYSDHFIGLFSEAVRCRLRSHGRVGSDLSGGLDSSSVVSMAQRLGNRDDLETFSLIFPGKACDERPYIDAVLEKWKVPANFDAPQNPEGYLYLDQVRRYRDFPDYPNSIMSYPLKALAREKGFRVVLSGDGGDQWLEGSPYYSADLLRRLKFLALWQHVRFDSCGSGPRGHLRHFLRYGLAPLLPASAADRRWGRNTPPDYVEEEFAHKINLIDRIKSGVPKGSFRSLAQREIYQTLTSGWAAHGNEMGDRALSWLQVEQRHPLSDRRIIEFAMALPEEQRRKHKQSRFILRRAMQGILPEIVRTRSDKADFSHVFAEALQGLGGEALFDSLAIAKVGWVKLDAIRSSYQRFIQRYKAGDQAFTGDTWRLWMVFGIEAWFQEVFVNGGDRRQAPAFTKPVPECV